MQGPFPAYRGDAPYVFVCYAHEDSTTVYADMAWLEQEGVNLWYDEGITAGSEWTEDIAGAINNCTHVLYFVSASSVRSRHCRNEVQYAIEHDKAVLCVYLEPTDLPDGLQLSIGLSQALARYDLSDADYRGKVFAGLARPGATAFKPRARRQRWLAPSAVLACVVAIVVAMGFWREPDNAPDPNSIGVLPLEYRGPDSSDDYFADGLTDELIIALARNPELRVAPRLSSFYFKDRSASLDEIGRSLQVRYLLEGNVLRTSGDFRISLRLIDVKNGSSVWQETYSRDAQAIFAVQNDIAGAVTRSVLPDTVAPADSGISTRSTVAFDHYLKGRALLRTGRSAAAYQAALEEFDTAIRIDANFAEAYAARCETYLSRYRRLHDDADFTEAEAACFRALTLQDRSHPTWQVHAALGELYRVAGRQDKAIAELSMANTIHPNSPEVLRYLGAALAASGDVDGAETTLRHAIAIDPSDWETRTALAAVYYDQHRYEESAAVHQQVLDVAPEYTNALLGIGSARYMLGDREGASEAWIKVEQSNLPIAKTTLATLHSNLGTSYYYDGDFESAVESQTRATQLAPNAHEFWGRLAESQRGAGHPDEEKAAYERAIAIARQTLLINPNDWETHGLLAIYLAFSGLDGATDHAARMLAIDPDNPTAHYFAALVSYALHNYDAALASLNQAVSLGFSMEMIRQDPDLKDLAAQLPEQFAAIFQD